MLISLWTMGIIFILYFAFSFPFVLQGIYNWKINKMLKTFVQERGTGKTTKVIKLLNEDLDAILIIPFEHMKNIYPKKFHHRIISSEKVLNGGLRGRKFTKVILDEGFAYQKEKLAQLYYYLGYNHIKTVSYGTV
jgi:hypothetical protein